MINHSLREFADRVLDAKSITESDVKLLTCDVLPHDLMSRDQADLLIALDRAVPRQCPLWGDTLVALVVDFVVWVSRPTGFVEAASARWLVGSLGANGGPTHNALRIACEVVREAEHADEALLAFVMQGIGPADRNTAASQEWQRPLPANPA